MPERKTLTKITDDIYQLRLPLPFALNHVNVYLLHGTDGWTIVDCGINWQAGRKAWLAAFDELKIKPEHIEQIILTHVHPDHFGLSGWLHHLAQEAGKQVPVKTSLREDQQAANIWRQGRAIEFGKWLQVHGVPAAMANDVNHSMDSTFKMTLPHPPPLDHIGAGQQIRMGERDFTIIHAPGHSDGQILFFDEADSLLLSGDHVLMKITPNIGLWEETDPQPLARFMNSLTSLRDLEVRLALPGHRRLIEDWSGRIDELLAHHYQRLDNVADAVKHGCHTPYQVTNRIFETTRFTPHEWRFAIAETLAHLEYLRDDGTLQQAPNQSHFTIKND